MKVVHVMIHGRVHGVGFRQFVKQNAVTLGLVGWVQNNDDRTVECMLQPSASSGQEGDENIKKMLELLHVGPMLAEIKNVEVNYMDEPFDFKEFEIVDGAREVE